MPTENRRIAAYIPKEIDEKFQAFKQKRGVGDSQALILVLTEFLKVSRPVAYSGDSLDELKGELLDELKKEILVLDNKISELRSELLSEFQSKILEVTSKVDASKDLKQSDKKQKIKNNNIQKQSIKTNDLESGVSLTFLGKRLNCDRTTISRKAKSFTKQAFADYTKNLDPDDIAWEYQDNGKLYPLPASLSEG